MLNELCKEAYENAKSKGWHEQPRTALELHMLIVSEIAEATEEARKGAPPIYKLAYTDGGSPRYCPPGTPGFLPPSRPEGELIELADAVIRILDYCGSKNWDLEEAIRLKMEFNKSRPHRHGGKLA
jgi:NTP pyrophosphatase (non-canonical NTP hydrolase)